MTEPSKDDPAPAPSAPRSIGFGVAGMACFIAGSLLLATGGLIQYLLDATHAGVVIALLGGGLLLLGMAAFSFQVFVVDRASGGVLQHDGLPLIRIIAAAVTAMDAAYLAWIWFHYESWGYQHYWRAALPSLTIALFALPVLVWSFLPLRTRP